jgi:CRP/FNR family cyclic AMP-dependent transcriptional regulator
MTSESILLRSPWFMDQPQVIRTALIDEGRTMRLQPNQWIYSEGDTDSGIYGVLEGTLRVEAAVGQDRSVLLNIVGAGEFIGQARAFGGGGRIVTARASGAATVLAVSDSSLARIAQREPDIWRVVSALVYAQLNGVVQLTALLLGLPPRMRIAARLLALPTDGAVTCVTQDDLAEMCGLSRKAVNAHLKALMGEGLVRTGYGGVRVLSRSRLHQLVQSNSS